MAADDERAAQQIAAISGNLAALFADYCARNTSLGLERLMQEFHSHRLDLVMTAHVTATGTNFICCVLPVGGDLVRLFDVYDRPYAQSGEVH
jgi:hypothetical protein